MNPKIAVVSVIVVLVLGGGAWLVSRGGHNVASGPQTSNSSQTVGDVTVTYGSGGFSPTEVSLKSGQSITFKNGSTQEIQVDSDPHPVHTDDTDLNVGPIAPGQSKTVTLTKKGSYGYHNHLNPSDIGRVTVE